MGALASEVISRLFAYTLSRFGAPVFFGQDQDKDIYMNTPITPVKDFSKSREQSFRREVRKVIRSTDELTKTQKEITIYLVNLWFYHRNGPKPYIHPGLKMIERKTGACRRTIQDCLKNLRSCGVIVPVGFLDGKGKNATRYIISIEQLLLRFDALGVQNYTSILYKVLPHRGAIFAPCIEEPNKPSKKEKHSDSGTNNIIEFVRKRA